MSSDKSWDRSWSTDEIIANSGNWSLAGDVALLNNLKKFADNLIKNTEEIDGNLHKLTNKLDEASLQLEIAQNRFQSLRNTQFIESRVYEDDETLHHVDKPTVQSSDTVENIKDKDHTNEIKEAVFKGLDILEKYYDKIEVSISDSSSDDGSQSDVPSHILRPKDPYLNRPLPFVIGSEEWHKNWHVGLEDSSSDSETEKISENYSESGSEDDLQVTFDRSQLKGSETSSELDLSKNDSLSNNKPPYKPDVVFGGTSDSDSGRIPATDIISSENFAKQLSEKLGDVIGRKRVEEPEINKRPITVIPPKAVKYGDAFFDEPPPLDDDDVTSEKGGLFSSNTGLFDDDDDDEDDMWNQNKNGIRSRPVLPTQYQSSSKLNEGGLFDDGSVSGDDMFSDNKKLPSQQFIKSDEQPTPKLDQKKKPIGGVSIFGASDLFDKKLLRRRVDSDDESEVDSVDNQTEKKPAVKLPIAKKKLNLFEDDDDDVDAIVEKSVSGSRMSADKKKIDLFNDKDGDDNEDMFTASVNVHSVKSNEIIKINEKEASDVKKLSLFGDDDTTVEKTENSKPVKKTVSLFDDDDDLFKDDLFSSTAARKFTSSLFDDHDSPDIFSEPKSNVINEKIENETSSGPLLFDSPSPDELFADKADLNIDLSGEKNSVKSETIEKYIPPLVNSPPPSDLFADKEDRDVTDFDDDLFSTTSKNDLFEDIMSSTKHKFVSLFDSSPPSDNDDVKVQDDVPPNSKKANLFDSCPPPDDISTSLSSEKNVSGLFRESPSLDFKATSVKDSSDIFASSPINDDDLFATSRSLKVTEIAEKLEKDESIKVPPLVTSPGKLKHNLNINVDALMPGSRPTLLNKNRQVEINDSKEIEKEFTAIPSVSKSDGGGVEVLQSVTKDRARVPLNRRPSTRRGRQASIRNSQNSDFFISSTAVPISAVKDVTPEPETSTILTKEVSIEKVFSEKPETDELFGDDAKLNLDLSTDLFPEFINSKTDQIFGDDAKSNLEKDLFSEFGKDDFLDSAENYPKTELFKQEAEVESNIADDLFGEPELKQSLTKGDERSFKQEIFTSRGEKSGLFDGDYLNKSLAKPQTSKLLPREENDAAVIKSEKCDKVSKGGLFDEDDDDDDLFTTKLRKSSVPSTSKTQKSLFDDDNDDDDIFKPSKVMSSQVKKPETKIAIERKIVKVRKLENTKSDDDPLSAFSSK